VLGLEARESLLDELGGHPFALEIVADRRIAEATPGKRLRPRRRHAGIVDQPHTLERVEGVFPCGHRDAGGREPDIERLPRAIARPQGTRGPIERIRTAELPGERPRRLTIERASDDETRARGRVDRHEPPRGAVEMDLDAAARLLAQRRDDGCAYAASASSPSSPPAPAPTAAATAATAAAFDALLLPLPFSGASSTTGSRRAEIT
jgi:hypothetical protein